MVIRLGAGFFARRLCLVTALALTLSFALSCKSSTHVDDTDLASSTDPLIRTQNSHSDLPEFVMTKELPDVSRRLTNKLNTCWLQAGLKELEITYYRESHGNDAMPFSAEYMMASALHERFLRIVKGEWVRAAELESGGEMNEDRELILKYGLLPERSWPDPANDWGMIARQLNPTASRLRRKFLDHQSRGTSTDAVMDEAEASLQSAFSLYNVHIPTWFLRNGARTTPVEFARSFVHDDPKKFVMYIARSQYPTLPTKADLYTKQDAYRTSWENIERAIIHEVGRKASVLTSIYWSSTALRITHDGLMKVVTHPFPSTNLEGHVVNIVGYHLNDRGRIDRIKIENTWGRYSGAAGFYSITWEDLKDIYMGISVPEGFRLAETQGMLGDRITN